MNDLPSESLQPFAIRIARALCTSDHAQVQALCNELPNLLPAPGRGPRARTKRQQSSNLERIGIWARGKGDENAPFKRLDRFRPEWRLWADVEEIAATGTGPRIAFMGESVARGLFFDPVFAPASVLQKLLRHLPGLRELEVVDLARSNSGPADIVELADQAAPLKPDLIVVFAGNNWSSSPHFPASFRDNLAAALTARGYRGYIDRIEHWRYGRTEAAMTRLAAAARNMNVRVIVVVPETNLVDWREDGALLVPILPGGGNVRWYDLARRAQAALGDGRYDEAAGLAQQLIRLDRGTSPVGLSVLARCRLSLGDAAGAREVFELARDVRRALPIQCTPAISSSIQRALRDSRQRHGFEIVDVPQIMQERLGGRLPDRRVFLDYCHLTSEGIALVTAAVARAAARLLGVDPAPDWGKATDATGTTPEVEADAHFMAAIHCARWQQPEEIVRFHCARAVALSPAIVKRMAGYLETFGRTGPPWLGENFPALAGPEGSPTYRYFGEVSPFVSIDFQNEPLTDAFRRTIGQVGAPGVATADRSAIPDGRSGFNIDLLSSRCFVVGRLDAVTFSRHPKVYFEAYEPVSRFAVHVARDAKCRLDMTYRTPMAEPDTALAIHLNGSEIGTFAPRQDWTSVAVENLVLNAGRNEIAVAWPRAQGATEARMQRSVAQLRQGMLPNPLMEFGHCHRFRLVDMSRAATQ